jgi:hypothetical protein
MRTNLNQSSFLCNVNEAQMNTLLVAVFLISYFLFKFISNKHSPSQAELERRRRKAEKYLNKYKAENEEFFMPTEN